MEWWWWWCAKREKGDKRKKKKVYHVGEGRIGYDGEGNKEKWLGVCKKR